MPVSVANTNSNNNLQYFRNRVNEIAHALSTVVFTADGSAIEGNLEVNGSFLGISFEGSEINVNTGNFFEYISIGNTTVNTVINSSSITLSNSSVEFSLLKPNTSQISGDYYLHANGSWAEISIGYNLELNVTGISAHVIDTFSRNNYFSAEYLLHVKNNSANGWMTSKVLILHDVGNSYLTEYGTLISNNVLGTFSTDVSGSNIRLIFNSSIADANVKLTRIIL